MKLAALLLGLTALTGCDAYGYPLQAGESPAHETWIVAANCVETTITLTGYTPGADVHYWIAGRPLALDRIAQDGRWTVAQPPTVMNGDGRYGWGFVVGDGQWVNGTSDAVCGSPLTIPSP